MPSKIKHGVEEDCSHGVELAHLEAVLPVRTPLTPLEEEKLPRHHEHRSELFGRQVKNATTE